MSDFFAYNGAGRTETHPSGHFSYRYRFDSVTKDNVFFWYKTPDLILMWKGTPLQELPKLF